MKKTSSNTVVNSTAGYVRITIIGFAISALWSALHSIILPVRLLDLVSNEYKNTYLGLMTFTGLALAILTQPVAGRLSDLTAPRWGRSPFIIIGVTVAAISIFGIGFFGTYILVFAFYCLAQIASNAAQGPYQAFIPEMVPRKDRGRACGIKSLVDALGGVAILYPAAFFMDRYNLGVEHLWLYAALGLVSVVLFATLLITVLTVKEPSAHIANSNSRRSQTDFLAILKGNHHFARFLISRLLFFLSFTTIQTFALYFLRDMAGITRPAAATASFLAVAAGGMLITVYPAGYLSDRFGRRPVGMAAGIVGGAAIALLLFFQQHFLVLVIASGLMGIALGIFISTNWALATDLAVPGQEAVCLALANAATAGGSAGARLLGPLIDYFNGVSPDMGYSVMLWICLAAITMGTLLLIERRRTQPHTA